MTKKAPVNNITTDQPVALHLINTNTKEISFEPTDLSDLTLHFKDHAFRVHAIILCKESAFFSAAIKAAKSGSHAPCSLSSACSKAGRRCLKLLDTLGGINFTASEMEVFLRHMYDGSLLLSTYYQSEAAANKHWQIGFNHQIPAVHHAHHHYGGLVIQPSVTGVFTVQDNQLSVNYTEYGSIGASHFVVKAGGTGRGITAFHDITASSPVVSTQDARLNLFLSKHSQLVELSHYFECASMLKYEEQCCTMLLNEAQKHGQWDALWRLLVLSEHCHWKMTTDIIKAVAKDKQFKTRPSWAIVSKSVTSATFATLLELMVA